MASKKTQTAGEEPPKKRASGPSGKHRSPQRLLSQSEEAWVEQDAHAAARGETWGEWARGALAEALRRQRARKAQ